MFRKMRRFGQELSQEECRKILQEEKRGVLAVLGDDEYPYTIPIDYYYDPGEDRIYFHGAGEGHKIDAIRRHDKVSFCVYDSGHTEGDDWALYIKSVVVFGRLSIIEDRPLALQAARNIGLKFYPSVDDVDELLKRTADRITCLELVIEHVTGKLVHEK